MGKIIDLYVVQAEIAAHISLGHYEFFFSSFSLAIERHQVVNPQYSGSNWRLPLLQTAMVEAKQH